MLEGEQNRDFAASWNGGSGAKKGGDTHGGSRLRTRSPNLTADRNGDAMRAVRLAGS